MSIKKLKEILDEINYPVYVEVVDCIWAADCIEAYWNTDDNMEDFKNGDGYSYSVEIRGEPSEYDGYKVINADTGCGETVTYFFNLEKEIKF